MKERKRTPNGVLFYYHVLNKFLFDHIDYKTGQQETTEQEEIIDASWNFPFTAMKQSPESAVGNLVRFEHHPDAAEPLAQVGR